MQYHGENFLEWSVKVKDVVTVWNWKQTQLLHKYDPYTSGFLRPDSLFSGQTDERCFNGCDSKRVADSGSPPRCYEERRELLADRVEMEAENMLSDRERFCD